MAIAGVPLFPVTVVGSWARPAYLVDALRKRQQGDLTFAEFNEVADQAVLEALRCQDEAGVDIVSDGEQRRDNFYSFVVEKLDGVKLMALGELLDYVEDKEAFDQILRSQDAPSFAIHNATVTDKISPTMPLAMDEFEFLQKHTDKPIRIALPGPTCSPAPCGWTASPTTPTPPWTTSRRTSSRCCGRSSSPCATPAAPWSSSTSRC